MESYGSPGGGLLGATGRYGPGAPEAGAAGELATAKLIEAVFSADADVVVFHDLAIPGPGA